MNPSKKKKIPASRGMRSAPSLKSAATSKKGKSKINAAEALKREKNGLGGHQRHPELYPRRLGIDSRKRTRPTEVGWCLLPKANPRCIHDASPYCQAVLAIPNSFAPLLKSVKPTDQGS